MQVLINRVLVATGVLLLLVGLPSSLLAASVDDGLTTIEQELTTLEDQVAQMRGRYVNPLKISEERQFDHRFERAEFLYRTADYVHASILLTDLLSYPDVEKRRVYEDLLWYLGDSLAHNNNYLSAREYLEKVVKLNQSHFNEAIIRLIQISVKQSDFAGAERYYGMMSRSAGAAGWDLIQYAYAKSLHKKGDLERALRTFEQIPQGSNNFPQARYFVGVIYVEMGRLDDAYRIFMSVRDMMKGDGEKAVALRQLSILAGARILFEQQKYEDALSLYRLIPVESKYFDQAYYEVTWIYIQKGKYTEAANTLDILLLALPDSIYAPNAQVLKGNIHMLEGRFADARHSFQLVINKYAGVVDTMETLLQRSEGKSAEAIQEMLFGEGSSLPPVALAWLAQEEDVAAALEVSKALSVSFKDVEEARRIIASLRMHLTQESKAKLFPALREGRESGEQIELRLTAVRKRLIDLEVALVGDRITAEERKQLESLQAQRRELEMVYDRVPKTVQERHERRERQIQAVEKVEQEVYQLSLQLQGIEEMIAEIMSRYEQMRGDPRMSQRYLQEVEQEVAAIQQVMRETRAELARLQRQVERRVEETKIGDDSRAADARIRRQLEAAIAAEKALLEKMRNRLGQDEAKAFDRIESAKRKSDQLDSQVQVFFRDLEDLVAERVALFLKQVEHEEQMLSGYATRLAVLRGEAETLAATIAYNNMQTVRDRFYSVYLKANVGIIDIAWEKRQRIRDKIEGLLDQRVEEQRQLNESFEGIR